MKVDPRRAEAFLRAPGACRAVLLYGDDTGLIRSRATDLVRAVAGSTDDPFRVADLEREATARLSEEMDARSLTGGRRAVRLRDATDALLPQIERALRGSGDALMVVEGPGLAAKSKLRAFMERGEATAAIACYPVQGRDLAALIQGVLAEAQVTVDADALAWLTDQLGADQAVTLREIEKLIAYAGPGGRVDAEAARLCVGDLSGLSLDDALFCATAGDVAGTDRALELAMAEGAAPVAVLRQALGHVQRLHRARLTMADGGGAAQAAKTVRPPLFFRREPAFIQALGIWSADGLQAAGQRLWEAERACKRTGAPDMALARSSVLGIAQRAARMRRR